MPITITIIIVAIFLYCVLLWAISSYSKQKKKDKLENDLLLELENQKLKREQELLHVAEEEKLRIVVRKELTPTIIKVRCRNCNALNDEGNRHCVECGKKV